MCWGGGRGAGSYDISFDPSTSLEGGQKKNPDMIGGGGGGLKKMKGQNKEIIVAHPLDKLLMLPKDCKPEVPSQRPCWKSNSLS